MLCHCKEIKLVNKDSWKNGSAERVPRVNILYIMFILLSHYLFLKNQSRNKYKNVCLSFVTDSLPNFGNSLSFRSTTEAW